MAAVKQEEVEDVYAAATAVACSCYGSKDTKPQERAMATATTEAEEDTGEEEAAAELIPGLPDDVAMECLARVPSRSHRRMRRVCRRWRGTVGSSPEFRRRRGTAGASEHVVFLVLIQTAPGDDGNGKGSSATTTPECALSAANLTTGEWRRVRWPAEAWGPVPLFAQCAAAGGGDVVAVVGGWDPATLRPTRHVRLLDVPAGAWRSGAEMPDGRSFFGCAAGGNGDGCVVYVAGGHDEAKNALRSAFAYSVAADAWRALPDMAEERDEPQLVLAGPGGRVLAAGGYATEAQGAFKSTAEWYDDGDGAWTTSEEGDVVPGGTACVLASVRGTVWAVGPGKGGVREWDGGARAWRGVADGPPGMKACVKAVGVGNGNGGAVFVFGTVAAEEEEGAVKYCAWVMETSGGGGAWRRVPVPSGFGGFVYSAAAVLV